MTCSHVWAGGGSCPEMSDYPGDWCASCRELFEAAAGRICEECLAFIGDEEGVGDFHEETCRFHPNYQ